MQLTGSTSCYVLSYDFSNKWVGQTGKIRTFKAEARLSAGIRYRAGLGQRFFLCCIPGIVLQRGLMGLNGQTKRQRNLLGQ